MIGRKEEEGGGREETVLARLEPAFKCGLFPRAIELEMMSENLHTSFNVKSLLMKYFLLYKLEFWPFQSLCLSFRSTILSRPFKKAPA